MRLRLTLLCLWVLCTGFEWPGRSTSLQRELSRADAPRRAQIAAELARYPRAQVHESLLRLLEDDAVEVRLAAASSAAAVGLSEARPILLDWMEAPEPEVRATGVTALGALDATGAPPASAAGSARVDAVATLQRALDDADASVRRAAAAALEVHAASRTTDSVIQALIARLGDADSGVREASVRALGAIGNVSAVPALLPVLQDPAASLRVTAATALGRLHDARALPGLLERSKEADLTVARAAVVALGELGDAGAIDALSAPLENDAAKGRVAAYALARMSDPRALSPLQAALARGQYVPDVNAALAERDRRASEHVVATEVVEPPAAASARAPAALSDAELQAQLAALSVTAVPERFGELASTLRRLEQAERLSPAARQSAMARLSNLAASSDDRVAVRALAAVRTWAPREGAALVAGLLASPSEDVRVAAASALAAFGDDDTRRLLRYVLLHASPELTLAAAVALGEAGDHRDAGALVKLTQRKRWPIPAAASYALARLAQRGVIKKHAMARTLCSVATSADPAVRANIAAALAALGADTCDAARTSSRPAPTAREPVDVHAYAADGQSPLAHRLLAVRSSDGAVFLGYSDGDARLWIPSAPRGPLLLEDPSAAALDPVAPEVTEDAERRSDEADLPLPPTAAPR